MPLLSLEELEQISPVFRGKIGHSFAKGLKKCLSVDKADDLYDRFRSLEGYEFTQAAFEDIGFSYTVGFCGVSDGNGNPLSGKYSMSDDLLRQLSSVLPEGPFITVSNHPCGHVDGMILVDMLSRVRGDYKVLVNEILARIRTLEPNFISVTPMGAEKTAPTAASLRGVKLALRHLSDGGCIGLFPSGAVSDLSLKDKCVRDRQWQEPVIRMIQKAKVPVVPIRFFDGNSRFYYSLGLIDWRIRLARLVSEVFNKKGKVMRVGIGPVISVESQMQAAANGTDSLSGLLRSAVYDMEWK